MISVIIPTHNRLGMLKELLASIETQDYSNIEVIIINDACSDGTDIFLSSEAPKHNWIVINNEQSVQVGESRRKGLLLSKGDYVAFVDDDDFFTDDSYFSRAVDLFQEYSSLSIVAANSVNKYKIGGEAENYVNICGFIDRMKYLSGFHFKWSKPNPSFAVFRKSMLINAGVDTMRTVNDASIYMRALLVGDIFIEHHPVGVYRVHENNISKNLEADFIIKNLEEKDYVFQKLKKSKVPFSLSLWWYNTVRLTVDYYLASNPSASELSKVRKWCKKHLNQSMKLFIYFHCGYLFKLKKWILSR